MMTDNMKRAISLLNQIIEIEEIADKEHKTKAIQANKAEQSIGESWRLFYLKNLRELLISDFIDKTPERGAYDNKVA
jgi:hypothetical protein